MNISLVPLVVKMVGYLLTNIYFSNVGGVEFLPEEHINPITRMHRYFIENSPPPSPVSKTMLPYNSSVLSISSPMNKSCVFCKNNSYHTTFYRSHKLKVNIFELVFFL